MIIAITFLYCPFGANAPRYRGCLPATCYGREAIQVMGSIGIMIQSMKSSGGPIDTKIKQKSINILVLVCVS